MSFRGAHDFNIDTANMGSTNSGPVMFWNNSYHNGSTHNQAISSGGTPVTLYVGARPSARRRRPPAPSPPRRISQRQRSEYSSDSQSKSSEEESSPDESRPQLIAPQSGEQGRSQSSGASPPEQPPYSPAAPLDRQQSEYSSYSSPGTRSQGPPLPTSTPSNQPQYDSLSPGGSQIYQQAETWSPAPESQSSVAHAQLTPPAPRSETSSFIRTRDTPQSQLPPSGSPFVAGGDSFYAESEALPLAEVINTTPEAVARSSSGSSHAAESQNYVAARKKRTFWQRMRTWSSKKGEGSTKRR